MAIRGSLYIDGGGSSLKAFTIDSNHRCKQFLVKIDGNFNVQSGCRELLFASLKEILSRYPFEYIYLGLAGLVSENDKITLKETILNADLPEKPQHVFIGSDLDLVFQLYFSNQNGIVAILGTGSVFAAKIMDEIIKVGGYGKALLDPGSGYAIGHKAVLALLKHMDCVVEDHEFAGSFHEIFKSKNDVIHKVYQEGYPLQTLTYPVFELADRGNDTARRILKNEAHEVKHYVEALKEKLPHDHNCKIQFYGGLVDCESFYKTELLKQIR